MWEGPFGARQAEVLDGQGQYQEAGDQSAGARPPGLVRCVHDVGFG